MARWLIAVLLQSLALVVVAAPADIEVKILAFNDFHGNLQSPRSEAGVPVGGIDLLAGWVARLRADNPNTVVVSAGDLIGASPLVSALFHDEPTIEGMNLLGLDFNAVGNHEFDEGRHELLRLQQGGCHPVDGNSCQGAAVGTPVPFEGAGFSFLAANVVDTDTGATLLPAYGLKTFEGQTLAFIGLTLAGTPDIVSHSGTIGLDFRDEASTINALIPELRAQGIEAIIVLIHEGGLRPASTASIDDCQVEALAGQPIRSIVGRLDDAVDLVISGHTHVGYNCRLPNSAGRLIPVTQAQAAGTVLSDIDLRLDPISGEVLDVAVHNRRVQPAPDVSLNQTLSRLVNTYLDLAAPLARQEIGWIAAPVTNAFDPATGERTAGNLIADAQLFVTRGPEAGGADLALMNPGGVRSNLEAAVYPGPITYEAAYRMQPFGNALVTQTMTTTELKAVLEQQFPDCQGRREILVLQPSAGLHYVWQASAPPCERVRHIDLNGQVLLQDGQVLMPDATLRVTVNNFLAEGGDGFSNLRLGRERLGGMLDLDALMAYFEAFASADTAYDPARAGLPAPRIVVLP
jgi:5'-nucleotidase